MRNIMGILLARLDGLEGLCKLAECKALVSMVEALPDFAQSIATTGGRNIAIENERINDT